MERIKTALEKASANRAAGSEHLSRRSQSMGTSDSSAVQGPILYLQTRRIQPNQRTMQDHRILTGSDPVSVNAYKVLRTQVLQRLETRDWQTLGITSPTSGDGKTVTAINLAISLARELHRTVLLVDADLRSPEIHNYFGFSPEYGFVDYLRHSQPLEDVLVNPGIDRLVLLPNHRPIENSSEILASPAMGELVAQFKARYPSRLVLFDLPAVLTSDDALSFIPFIDAFLMVLRNGKTSRGETEQAFEVMKDANILGTVLNGCDTKSYA